MGKYPDNWVECGCLIKSCNFFISSILDFPAVTYQNVSSSASSVFTHVHTTSWQPDLPPTYPFGCRIVAELPDTHSQLPGSPATATVHQFSHSSPTTSCNNHFQMLLKNVLLSLGMQVTQLQTLEEKFFLTSGIIASNFP